MMDYEKLIELLLLIAMNLGALAKLKRSFTIEVKDVVMSEVKTVVDKLEKADQHILSQSEAINRVVVATREKFDMIYEVMQKAGQDDAEKFMLLTEILTKLQNEVIDLERKYERLAEQRY